MALLLADIFRAELREHREQQAQGKREVKQASDEMLRQPKKVHADFIGRDRPKKNRASYKRLPKNLDGPALIRVHVVGVIFVNAVLHSKVYFTYGNIRNDPNLTICVIQDIISNWEGRLPGVLYLQMDNTTAQNKNVTVLAYLNLLVQKGIFKKVKVGFLLVGHTHDQID